MVWDKLSWTELILFFCAICLAYIYYDARRFHRHIAASLDKEIARRKIHDELLYHRIAEISYKDDEEMLDKLLFTYDTDINAAEMGATEELYEKVDEYVEEREKLFRHMFVKDKNEP